MERGAETATGSEAAKKPRGEHARGLLLIGLFKMCKAAFFCFLGAMALHMIHQNFGDLVMRVVDALPVDPESHLVGTLMDKADLVGGHQLRQAGLFSFSYAALCVVEGVGLMMQQVWAEYFTVVLTSAALPWEIYELVAHYAGYRVVVLVSNVAVLLYLLWVLKQKKTGK